MPNYQQIAAASKWSGSTRSSLQSQPSFRGVRCSKFRHVYGSPAKKQRCYECIKITKNAHDAHFCAANPKFLAVVTETAGGGSFLVIPLNQTGRQDVSAGKVSGHRGPVLDIKWNPFNDNVIASCSDDCTVKVWYVPDGGLDRCQNLVKPMVDLHDGHRRRVAYIEWHPTAENILFSVGYDRLILVWNLEDHTVVKTIDCHPDTIHSISFNRDGSLLATTCKDKFLRIINPRTGDVVSKGICHQGAKASKAVFLGDTGKIFTTGFSKYSDRQWAVWSESDLSQPLRIENIDSSSGVLFPYYDQDTKMVFVAGKGDGNIRYYEIVNEAPWCHYLSQFLTGCPQRGLGFMPKRGVDTLQCEIFRFYKLHATKDLVEPISMIVPRKSDQFQGDIFPDTNGPTPALSAAEWLAGENRNPILVSLRNGTGLCTQKPQNFSSTLNLHNNNNVNGDSNGTLGRRLSKSHDGVLDRSGDVTNKWAVHTLPVATFVKVDDDHDGSGADEADLQLRKLCQSQASEIKYLKELIDSKDRRINELETQIENLLLEFQS